MFNSNLNRCRCGHFDLEHELLLSPSFTPVGAGACRVCPAETCAEYADKNGPLLSKTEEDNNDSPKKSTADQAEWGFMTRLVNDNDYLRSVLKTVFVNRLNFLEQHYEANVEMDGKKDYSEVIAITQKIRSVLFQLGRLRLDETTTDRWRRRYAILLTFLSQFKASLRVRYGDKVAVGQEG